jgi:ABC-type transport system substrate-binding protein
MRSDYWYRLQERRLTRRRSIGVFFAGAAGAGLLAACGSDGSSTTTDSSSLLTEPIDTTKTAKVGGIMRDRALQDPATLDPNVASNPWDGVGPHMFSALVEFRQGYMKPTDNEVIPDIAESWETSADGLQLTLKIRSGVKWHNKAPVNGRAMDMDDVLFSWERFSTKAGGRTGVVNAINPSAPVLSVTATDTRTLVIKLAEPIVYGIGLFANNYSGYMLMLPKETDTTFDPRADMIGTGPFMLANYTPSVGFTLKRHPEYFDKSWAYVDQIDKPIITEYAAVLSQFKAGNLYTFGSHLASMLIGQEDVLGLKREQPEIAVYSGDLRVGGGGSVGNFTFGWLPEGKSPLLDERVRQAISMSIDRDLYADTFNNVRSFTDAGLPVETRWNTALNASTEGWWLDPKSKDFGANAKYMQLDIAEGKKLLAAAGYANGFPVTSHYVTGGQLGELYGKSAAVVDGMISELGITPKVEPIDYTKEYIPLYRDGKGQWDGWAYKTSAGGITGGHAIGILASQFWSKGGSTAFHGFSTSGKNDMGGDPQLDAMIARGRIERDTEKLRSLVFDIQRYIAKSNFALSPPAIANTFTVAWPCVQNYRVFRGGNTWQNYGLWLDQTKPPFKPT